MFRISALFGAFLLASSISGNAATLTLFDDDFNADIPYVWGYSTVTSLTNWDVLQGNVDTLDNVYGCTGCIDLDGSGSPAPAILQTKSMYNFMANVWYTVTLYFSPGTQAEDVAVNLATIPQVTFPQINGNITASFQFLISGDYTDYFQIALGGPVDNFGPYLDRFQVTYEDTHGDPAPVPLPAGAPLLLGALAAIGMVKRRKA